MRGRSLKNGGRLWLAMAICAYSLVSYFLERAYPDDWANWNHGVGGLAMVWYVYRYYRSQRDVVLTSFLQIYSTIGMLASAAIVSTGVFMFEVAQFGNQNGIFWVVMGYFVVGFEATGLGYRFAERVSIRPRARPFTWRFERTLILAITGAALLLCAYVFARYRGPLLLGIDRVTFWRTVAPTYLGFIPALVIQTFFFPAFYYLWMRRVGRSTTLPALILFAYVAAAVLVLGQKFSAFIVFMNAWAVVLAGVLPHFKVKPSHVLAFAGILTLLVVSVVVSYVLMGREAAFVLARVALQAQVLWSVFDDSHVLSLWPNDWQCYFHCGQFDDGQDFASYAYLPQTLYRFYYDGGSQLSGWMPALSILTFGVVVSLVTHVLVSFALGFIQRKVVAALSRRNMVYAFLVFKVHLSLTLMWFAALTSAAFGIVLVIIVAGLYRWCFPLLAEPGKPGPVPPLAPVP